jgi:hypothetical protein
VKKWNQSAAWCCGRFVVNGFTKGILPMQWPQLNCFLVCQRVEGSIDSDGFNLCGMMRRDITLPRRHVEGEIPWLHFEVYSEVFTEEPVEPENFTIKIVGADGTEVQWTDGMVPTLRMGFAKVPGWLCYHAKIDASMLPGEYSIQAFWGERQLGKFPCTVKDREGNPRLADPAAQAVA